MTKPIGLSNTPFYIRDKKNFAIDQENYRHDQALYSIGELAFFALMWKVEDFTHGYVRRCPRCYNDRATAVYNQATKNQCPMCYGTTFEGGVRAKIIRPTIFSDADDQEVNDNHGTKYPQSLTVETTSDFRYRPGDYVFRADGSRWQLSAPQRVTVRTGFGHPSQNTDSIGYASSMATLEDPTSVAWMIPPNEDDLKAILSAPIEGYPVAQTDQLFGPLIPDGLTD